MKKIPHLRWWIVGLIFFASVLNYIDRQALSILAPTIQKELNLSNEDYASVLNAFLIAYTVALLSFWVLDVSTFIFIQFAFEFLASGHLFPLDILPDSLHRLLLWTPYPYLLYFPVGVYLGRIQGADLWQGFVLQGVWVVAAFLIARFVWSRGLRKYTAVGG